MSASASKIAAARENGRKAKGRPRDTSRSRRNATIHGLTSRGLTEFDDTAEHEQILRELQQQEQPVGAYEQFLVTSTAFAMLRCTRARRLEAENFEQALHQPKYEKKSVVDEMIEKQQGKVLDPGIQATVKTGTVENVSTLHRYETPYFNAAAKAMRELKFHQRVRKQECSRNSDSEHVLKHQSNLADALPYHESNAPTSHDDGSSAAAAEATKPNSVSASSNVTENQVPANEPTMVEVTAPKAPCSDRPMAADTVGERHTAKSWFPYRNDGPAWRK
ncbi:MAG: hypothetical protein ACM3WP_02530 [Acidobacteriota bacterium]